jgi:dihydrofolate reductase
VHTDTRKLTYYVASTVDGFIAGPDGSWDFFPVEGEHMADLSVRYPEAIPTHVRQAIGVDPGNVQFDTVLMGRGTYQPALDIGVTSPYAHLKQYVFSRSLKDIDDPAVEIVDGDPASLVRQLKREDGAGIWLCGGGQLAYQLLPEIDELAIKLYPMVIGEGVPLFAGSFQVNDFTLAESHTYGNGVALMTYARNRA